MCCLLCVFVLAVWTCGVVQTIIYCDFFYYYFKVRQHSVLNVRNYCHTLLSYSSAAAAAAFLHGIFAAAMQLLAVALDNVRAMPSAHQNCCCTATAVPWAQSWQNNEKLALPA
jgi:hypothetical protein